MCLIHDGASNVDIKYLIFVDPNFSEHSGFRGGSRGYQAWLETRSDF